MASILDAGLAGIFSAVFVWLLVYAIVYGFLTWKKPFGDNKGSYAIVAVCIAFLMAVAPPARTLVLTVAPWYVAFGIVIFFILFLVTMFGVDPAKDFPKIIGDSNAQTWFIIICVVIAIAGLAAVFGQSSLNQQPNLPAPSIDTDGDGIPDSGSYVGTAPEPGMPGSTATGDFGTNLLNTLVHPKVLGLAATFLIAAIAVYFLSKG